MKYFSSDRPTAAARQGREAVEEFAVRAWIGAGSDKDPNVIAVDLHAVHLVVRRSDVRAGEVPQRVGGSLYRLNAIGTFPFAPH